MTASSGLDVVETLCHHLVQFFFPIRASARCRIPAFCLGLSDRYNSALSPLRPSSVNSGRISCSTYSSPAAPRLRSSCSEGDAPRRKLSVCCKRASDCAFDAAHQGATPICLRSLLTHDLVNGSLRFLTCGDISIEGVDRLWRLYRESALRVSRSAISKL